MQQKTCQFFHQIDKSQYCSDSRTFDFLFFVCLEGKIKQCNKRTERTILG